MGGFCPIQWRRFFFSLGENDLFNNKIYFYSLGQHALLSWNSSAKQITSLPLNSTSLKFSRNRWFATRVLGRVSHEWLSYPKSPVEPLFSSESSEIRPPMSTFFLASFVFRTSTRKPLSSVYSFQDLFCFKILNSHSYCKPIPNSVWSGLSQLQFHSW